MTDNSWNAFKPEHSVYNVLIFLNSLYYSYILMFFILTKIKNAMINILCINFTYKDDIGSCDRSLWQALIKVILDLYFYNFHYKPLCIYIYYGQVNIFWFWFCLILRPSAYHMSQISCNGRLTMGSVSDVVWRTSPNHTMEKFGDTRQVHSNDMTLICQSIRANHWLIWWETLCCLGWNTISRYQ